MLAAGLIGTPALAAEPPAADAELEQIRDRLLKVLPEVERENIRRSPSADLIEIQQGGSFAYATADGRFVVLGDLLDLSTGEYLSEKARGAWRLAAVDKIDGGAIVFPAPANTQRYTLTVFTDIDCAYCRKLHQQIGSMNEAGITVRYLFFPRAGLRSTSADEARNVWCAADPQTALTKAKQGGSIKRAPSSCKDPVAAQYAVVKELGLNATPALLMPDGRLIYGYRSVDELLQELAAPHKDSPPG